MQGYFPVESHNTLWNLLAIRVPCCRPGKLLEEQVTSPLCLPLPGVLSNPRRKGGVLHKPGCSHGSSPEGLSYPLMEGIPSKCKFLEASQPTASRAAQLSKAAMLMLSRQVLYALSEKEKTWSFLSAPERPTCTASRSPSSRLPNGSGPPCVSCGTIAPFSVLCSLGTAWLPGFSQKGARVGEGQVSRE